VTDVDHDLVTRLLADESLSYREIARRAGCSDWSVRAIAKGLDGDARPMKACRSRSEDAVIEEDSTVSGWIVLGILVAGFAFMIWAGTRWPPPRDL
jgi:hypothetical protein